MSQRPHYPVQARDTEIKIIAGRFYQAASGTALDPSRQVGNGFTVARNGAGDYTITLEDAYPYLLHAGFSIFKSGGVNAQSFSITAEAVASPAQRNLRVLYKEAGIAADPGNNNSIGFHLTLRNKAAKL